MPSYQSGDVIKVYVKNQENPLEGTTRWAIIVENFGDECSIAPMTSQLHQAENYKIAIKILKESSDGESMNLDFDSLILCDRIQNVRLISLKNPPHTVVGKCPDELIDTLIGHSRK